MLNNNSETISKAVKLSSNRCNREFINSIQLLATSPISRRCVEKMQQHFVVHGKCLTWTEIMGSAKRSNTLVEVTLSNRRSPVSQKVIILDPRDVTDPILFDISKVRLEQMMRDQVYTHLISPKWLNDTKSIQGNEVSDNNPDNNDSDNSDDEDLNNDEDDDNLNNDDEDLNNDEDDNLNNDEAGNLNNNDDALNDNNNANEDNNANNPDHNEVEKNNSQDMERDLADAISNDHEKAHANPWAPSCDAASGCATNWHPRINGDSSHTYGRLTEQILSLEMLCTAAELRGINISIRARAKTVGNLRK